MRRTPTCGKRETHGGIESYKGRRFATSTGCRGRVSVSGMICIRLRPWMARPLVNAANQNKRMPLRPTPLTQWCVSLALLSATASPTPSFSQGTLEQRLACTPDVIRLCSEFIPDADQITICLREKRAELSDACRPLFEAAMNRPPNASDGTQGRKRATK